MTDQPSSSATTLEPADSTTAARRLTFLYVAALSTVALLTIVAQVLVQQQLESNQNDSHVVNIAGRQRMLSQRLAKSSLQLAMSSPTNFQSIQAEIAIALKEWDANHNGLQHRDKTIGLQSEPSQRLTELYATVRPHYDSIRLAAQTLVVAKPGDDLSEPIRIIGEHESAFLKGMDDIVSQCVLEAEKRIAGLRLSEVAL